MIFVEKEVGEGGKILKSCLVQIYAIIPLKRTQKHLRFLLLPRREQETFEILNRAF